MKRIDRFLSLKPRFHRYRLIFVSSAVAIGLVLAASAAHSRITRILGRDSTSFVIPQRAAEPRTGTSSRNLALQPEAAKLSRKLGKRFAGSKVSSLIGELTANNQQFSVQVVRWQHPRGEHLEISATGSSNRHTWNDSEGSRSNGITATGFDRSLVERLVFDNPDQFILAQLRGASYYTIARNVRPDEVGDSYDGPVWTVVRVTDPDRDEQRKPESSWRLYYINATTGLIDKIVSEVGGERTEANLSGWSTSSGETLPSHIVWTRGGQTIMEFRLTNFVLSDAGKRKTPHEHSPPQTVAARLRDLSTGSYFNFRQHGYESDDGRAS